MKKTLKEEMLEAIVTKSIVGYSDFIDAEKAATSCASIAEKRIKIARLEGFLEAIKMAGDGKITAEVVDIAIEELEQLEKQ